MSVNGPRVRGIEDAAIRSRDLAMIERAAPEYPPETCPQIDVLQARVADCDRDVAYIRQRIADSRATTLKGPAGCLDDVDDVAAALIEMKDELESLRTANDQLRRSGRFWHRAARELAKAAVG